MAGNDDLRGRAFDMAASSARARALVDDRLQEAARQGANIAGAAEATLLQARRAVEDFVTELARFERDIDPSEEARVIIVGGPAGTMLFPQQLGFLGHDRVRFEGVDDDGARVLVIQHVSQFNVMVKAKKVGQEAARRIGFHNQ